MKLVAVALSLAPLVAIGCARGRGSIPPLPALPALPFAADSVREHQLARGAVHRFLYAPAGPWAIHVLDVDLRCHRPIAVKGFEGAVGRENTSVLMSRLSAGQRVIGGVNADFFLFAPAGMPRGAHVENGRVVTGPSRDPVLTIDSLGAARVEVLSVAGGARIGEHNLQVRNWNRMAPAGVSVFDTNWGRRTDTATAVVEVVLEGMSDSRGRVVAVDTVTSGVAIPARGMVLMAGRNAPDSIRGALLDLRIGDTVGVRVALQPRHPRDAVGGRPVLVRDSAIVSGIDSTGGAVFAAARHPRTAVGLVGGRRLVLVVVDGRQKPYSDGMTLRELASLLLALGARDAVNLDGGGSSTLVYSDSAGRTPRVANRPSDQQGERAVGNALGIVQVCRW